MEKEEKLKAYEKMQSAIQTEYDNAVKKMEKLKAEDKTKSATYRQLMGKKLLYKDMLAIYEIYGLQVKA